MKDDAQTKKANQEENPHAGHRKRLKQQYAEHGLEPLTDVQALELLLTFAIPRKDTNETAHALLKACGSFRGVLESDAAALQKAEGVGDHAAMLVTLVAALNRRYLQAVREGGRKKPRLKSAEDFCLYAVDMFRYRTSEELWLICMDGSARVTGEYLLSRGDATSVSLPVRQIVELAVRTGAVQVVVTHNHLAELALPSKADVIGTKQLYHALEAVGVRLADHVVVADGDSVSMYASGFFQTF